MQSLLGFAVDALWLWLGASIAIYTLRLVDVAAFQKSPALEIPMSTVYWGMVFGGAYLTFVALRKLAARLRGGGEAASRRWMRRYDAGRTARRFAAADFHRRPDPAADGPGRAFRHRGLPDVVPALFPQKMFGHDRHLHSARAALLHPRRRAHVARRPSQQLVDSRARWWATCRPGLPMPSIVSSMVFAGVSGSSTADASAIGSIVIPTMKDAGYKPGSRPR